MDITAPRPAFAFRITLTNTGDTILVQEVSGLARDFETTEVVEGGENRFVHQLPEPAKHANLTLKRMVVPDDAPLVQWVRDKLEGDFTKPIAPREIDIALLDVNQTVQAQWIAANAYPVKWSIGNFDAMKNELAIETLELAYATLQRS